MPSRRWLTRVRAWIALTTIAVVPLVQALPAVAADSRFGYERTVRITFPVKGDVYYANTYDAPRSGGARVHQATDIMAAKMQRIYAAKSGTVCHITGVTAPMPSYGYMLTICGKDGLRYNYIHLNNDTPGTDDGKGGVRYAYAKGLAAGTQVVRGQFLGYVGDSGNAEATASHLHFEIIDPSLVDERIEQKLYDPLRINPYFSLRRAEARGDYPGVKFPQESTEPEPQPDPEPQPEPEPEPEPEPDPEPEPEPETPDVFRDIAGSAHREAVNQLARAGITGGCADTAYCPTDSITRAQMASLITRATVVPHVTGLAFDDIADSPHAAAINALASAGIVAGCGPRSFCPSEPVTRAQMATFLARAFKLTAQREAGYRDVAAADGHAASIAAISEAGITSGCTASRYCPHQVVTRGQMATFLYRATSS